METQNTNFEVPTWVAGLLLVLVAVETIAAKF
jgi:hypothetical protein